MRRRRSQAVRVGRLMTVPVVTATPQTTLEQVASLMLQHGIGSVLIVDPADPERPVGIVTESDLDVRDEDSGTARLGWLRLLGEPVWSERSLSRLYEIGRKRTAAEVMSSPVITIDEAATIWDAIRLMVDRDVKRLPVVRDGRLVGVISRRDLLVRLAAEPPET